MRFLNKKFTATFAVAFSIVLQSVIPLCAETIDIVYTWVDDADNNWQGLRQKYVVEYQPLLNNIDANTKNRYRNRDELKYSLRSIHKFASFVNHIYIVTSGQRPSWLKDDPKITIVDHQLIFPNKSDLPTFNSQAIEANLHRIPNLSEKFIYFNDDFFLGREVVPEDFFSRSGKIRLYTSLDKVPTGPKIHGESAYDSAWKNTNALLNGHFKKEKRYQVAHVPYALTKSLMLEVETQFPQIFGLVSSHKFRMPTDFTLTNGLIQYYALYTNRCKWDKTYLSMVRLDLDPEKNLLQFEKVKRYAYRFFCIEDVLDEDSEAVDKALQEFFISYFPDPAPWEVKVAAPLPNPMQEEDSSSQVNLEIDAGLEVEPSDKANELQVRGPLRGRPALS